MSVVQPIEHGIARCRIALSIAAVIAVFLDPTQPIIISRWISMSAGAFSIDAYVFTVLFCHFLYSMTVLLILRSRSTVPRRLGAITMWLDVLSGMAIAAFTEGVSSPMYAFVVFAVIAAGLTGGLRPALLATAISVVLYLSLIAISAGGNLNFYIMRPIYLGITGYLVGYLGEQSLKLEAGIRELATAQQRQRIARDLHDGRAQAFAAINLRLASCHRLLRQGRIDDGLNELQDLQASVNQEYDDLRTYMRSLVGIDNAPTSAIAAENTRFDLRINLEGSLKLVDAVMRVVREGISNVARHAHASTAKIDVARDGKAIMMTLDDDGVGFHADAQEPWTISAVVSELGGRMTIASDNRPGAHISIVLPAR